MGIGQAELGITAVSEGWRLGHHRPGRRWAAIWRSQSAWLLLLSAACALSLVLAFFHPFSLADPTARAALETCMALFALASGLLVRRQLVQARRLRNLLLFVGLVILTTTEFFANGLPAALDLDGNRGFITPLPLGQLAAAALFAAAAFTSPDRHVHRQRHVFATLVAASLALWALTMLGGLLIPLQVLAGPTSAAIRAGSIWRQPSGLIVVLVTAALFALAAVQFERRSRSEHNPVLSLVAGAALLFGTARLYHLALPAVSLDAVTLREAVRLAGYGAFFAAALLRDGELRSRLTRDAAISERQKVAEDLHDGLAQDLALIASHGPRLRQVLGANHPVVLAAQRALAVSRGTIDELSAAGSTSTGQALELLAQDMGERFSLEVSVDVQLDRELPSSHRTDIARIVREAIANAARHGRARHVSVTLKPSGERLVLRICDDGCGVAAASPATRGGGFGLRSMQERARRSHGSFALRRGPGGGTAIEVMFP